MFVSRAVLCSASGSTTPKKLADVKSSLRLLGEQRYDDNESKVLPNEQHNLGAKYSSHRSVLGAASL